METNIISARWTDENIIELIRKLRNDLIKDFLDERLLKEYLHKNFRVYELSPIKTELIKKDLKELIISPVNINHYDALINQIRENDSAAITEVHEKLFYKEVENIFKQYMY